MAIIINKKTLPSLLFVLLSNFLCVRAIAQHGVKQVQLKQFQLQSTELIKSSGKEISSPAYTSSAKWYPVTVPSTVLTGLVANKVYPSPYQGLNNMLIPDASDEFNKIYQLEKYSHIPGVRNPWKKPYWYRTSFTVSEADKGKTFQLIFKGINYRAEVWLNGKRVADSSQMVGMFAEHNLDVSGRVLTGGKNVMAVKIYPLDYPGLPAKEQLEALGPFYENGGPSGDIGKNVTMLCSAGWDWIPPVRDRNMGIWQPVYLRTTGSVTIGRPKLITSLPALPDTSQAMLSLDLTLSNHSKRASNGQLNVIIKAENFPGPSIQFSKPFAVKAGEARSVSLNADQVQALAIVNPKLWWPNGYGRANLYRIRLQYTSGGRVTDDTTFVFGIRTVSSAASEVKGFTRREFFVNGKRVHLNGGAWVPDMMVNTDSARYDYELHLCKTANVNLVRIWGGGITPPDQFWNDCDKYGLMVWSDFWITGDTQGEFKGSPDWPLESNVFINNVKSTIYRIRNHPSLLVWTGGNEGHARKELYDLMRESIIKLDGTRPYIPSSSGFAKLPAGWDGAWPDNKPTGVYSSGPYAWQDPKEYFRLADAGRDWVFKDETGLPSQPPYNTLSKNIPDTTWNKKFPFPLNDMWGYHDAATGAGKYDEYYKNMVERYGQPTSREEFSDKMQLMNATGYQGIFEAAGHKLTETGGVMLWKLNAAFPSVVWQIYDWYLQPNAGFYFMQNAVEPIHIQFNQNDSTIAVLNRTHHPTGPLTVEAQIYDIDSKSAGYRKATVNLMDEGVKSVASFADILKIKQGLSFVVINLKNGQGKLISHNAYWMSPLNDYKALNTFPKTQVNATVLSRHSSNGETKWDLLLKNESQKIAFFLHAQLVQNGEEIRPSYWSANYVTLAPHESARITVGVPNAKLGTHPAEIILSGWNIGKMILK